VRIVVLGCCLAACGRFGFDMERTGFDAPVIDRSIDAVSISPCPVTAAIPAPAIHVGTYALTSLR
jgi:hypothetical protein